jgi:aspartate 1-decarboxylase
MLLNVCIAKLHRATVTGADLNYVGSITIGKEILEAAGLLPGQMVQITNVSNAVLWRTYILEGEKGQIVLNGPPARLFQKGDKIIVLGEAWIDAKEVAKEGTQCPTVVFFKEDGSNEITEVKKGWCFE